MSYECSAGRFCTNWPTQAIRSTDGPRPDSEEGERSVGLVALALFQKRVALAKDRALLIAGCGTHRNTLRRVRRLISLMR